MWFTSALAVLFLQHAACQEVVRVMQTQTETVFVTEVSRERATVFERQCGCNSLLACDAINPFSLFANPTTGSLGPSSTGVNPPEPTEEFFLRATVEGFDGDLFVDFGASPNIVFSNDYESIPDFRIANGFLEAVDDPDLIIYVIPIDPEDVTGIPDKAKRQTQNPPGDFDIGQLQYARVDDVPFGAYVFGWILTGIRQVIFEPHTKNYTYVALPIVPGTTGRYNAYVNSTEVQGFLGASLEAEDDLPPEPIPTPSITFPAMSSATETETDTNTSGEPTSTEGPNPSSNEPNSTEEPTTTPPISTTTTSTTSSLSSSSDTTTSSSSESSSSTSSSSTSSSTTSSSSSSMTSPSPSDIVSIIEVNNLEGFCQTFLGIETPTVSTSLTTTTSVDLSQGTETTTVPTVSQDITVISTTITSTIGTTTITSILQDREMVTAAVQNRAIAIPETLAPFASSDISSACSQVVTQSTSINTIISTSTLATTSTSILTEFSTTSTLSTSISTTITTVIPQEENGNLFLIVPTGGFLASPRAFFPVPSSDATPDTVDALVDSGNTAGGTTTYRLDLTEGTLSYLSNRLGEQVYASYDPNVLAIRFRTLGQIAADNTFQVLNVTRGANNIGDLAFSYTDNGQLVTVDQPYLCDSPTFELLPSVWLQVDATVGPSNCIQSTLLLTSADFGGYFRDSAGNNLGLVAGQDVSTGGLSNPEGIVDMELGETPEQLPFLHINLATSGYMMTPIRGVGEFYVKGQDGSVDPIVEGGANPLYLAPLDIAAFQGTAITPYVFDYSNGLYIVPGQDAIGGAQAEMICPSLGANSVPLSFTTYTTPVVAIPAGYDDVSLMLQAGGYVV